MKFRAVQAKGFIALGGPLSDFRSSAICRATSSYASGVTLALAKMINRTRSYAVASRVSISVRAWAIADNALCGHQIGDLIPWHVAGIEIEEENTAVFHDVFIGFALGAPSWETADVIRPHRMFRQVTPILLVIRRSQQCRDVLGWVRWRPERAFAPRWR